MKTVFKYRFPRYKALPKGWGFRHDDAYSKRWENWKVYEVEGSYVTNYSYKACIFANEKDENEARKHYIVCEDGGADWNMPISYKQVEIDPETLRQETPYLYSEMWKEKPYLHNLWENDILSYHFKNGSDSDEHYGIVIWKDCNFVVVDLKTRQAFSIGGNSEIGVDKVFGTKFEFIHRNDIYLKNPDKNPFPEEFFKDIEL